MTNLVLENLGEVSRDSVIEASGAIERLIRSATIRAGQLLVEGADDEAAGLALDIRRARGGLTILADLEAELRRVSE